MHRPELLLHHRCEHSEILCLAPGISGANQLNHLPGPSISAPVASSYDVQMVLPLSGGEIPETIRHTLNPSTESGSKLRALQTLRELARCNASAPAFGVRGACSRFQ